MILTKHSSLEDHLVTALGREHMLSAADLYSRVTSTYGRCSIQAVYKELRKLQNLGVVVKSREKYSLSLSWILNLAELVDQMYYGHAEPKHLEVTLSPRSAKQSYTFTKLTKVDDFWIHSLLSLLQNSKEKILYQWIPHPWFHLIHSEKSWPFHNALRVSGFQVKSIIGGNTFLDQHSKRTTTEGVYEFSYRKGPFHDLRDEYYSVTDRHLLTVKLDQQKTNQLERLYSSIKSFDDFDVASVVEAVNSPGQIKLTIESSPKKIRPIWKQFREYFEVK
jgi:hypothetical protein